MGRSLLGGAQGGNEGGRERFIGPPFYLINDTFTTDRAAGAVNGTNAEPGPGRRTVFDTNGSLSLAGGNLTLVAGGVGVADPDLRYSAIDRAAGRVLVAAAIHTASGIEIGWDASGSGNVSDGIRVVTTTLAIRAGLAATTVGAVVAGTAYQYAIVQRGATGHLYFIKGGAFSNWTLIWVSGVGSSQVPNVVNLTATTAGTLDYIRVPAQRWLPAPLLSDGFSTFAVSAPTATDGLGHAEGVAGDLGSGGNGLWPYTQVGTWQASGGVASASVLSGGVALAYQDVGALDLIATVKITWVGGTAGLMVRGDANNHVRAVHNGTNAQLVKVVAGVPTTLLDVVATYVAGAEIRLIVQGTAFRLFYNNVAIGSEQTIADAALNTDGYVGLRTTDTGNTFDDLVVRARGTGGEYAALDAF